MQLTFAGKVIASEPTEGGKDAVTGFLPERHSTVQSVPYLRAANAFPIARFGRKRTLSMTITPGQYADLGTACQALLLFLDSLPDYGTLQVFVGQTSTIYAQACLGTVKAVKRYGVTIAVAVSFEVGPGSAADGLQSQSGNTLKSQDGQTLL